MFFVLKPASQRPRKLQHNLLKPELQQALEEEVERSLRVSIEQCLKSDSNIEFLKDKCLSRIGIKLKKREIFDRLVVEIEENLVNENVGPTTEANSSKSVKHIITTEKSKIHPVLSSELSSLFHDQYLQFIHSLHFGSSRDIQRILGRHKLLKAISQIVKSSGMVYEYTGSYIMLHILLPLYIVNFKTMWALKKKIIKAIRQAVLCTIKTPFSTRENQTLRKLQKRRNAKQSYNYKPTQLSKRFSSHRKMPT
ncbi:MAG: hypothetical protein EXX96DRAFT_641984 [Benjaminiella poitrasii]|nr:MAG: hypothetical protein EXX96DRAFT_641984 [Benjaminiella poitrasii]